MSEFSHTDGQQSGRACYQREWRGAVLEAEQVREIGVVCWWQDSGLFAAPSEQWLDEFVAGFMAAAWLYKATNPATVSPPTPATTKATAGSAVSDENLPMQELVNFMRGVEGELGLAGEATMVEATSRRSSRFLTFMQEMRRLAQERNAIEEKGTLNDEDINRLVQIARETETLVERARAQGVIS